MKTLLLMVNNMKKNKKKYIVIGLIVLALILFGVTWYLISNREAAPVEEIKKEDDIKTNEFDYVLYENKSPLYKEYFAKLKETLLKDEVNEEEYVKILSQLFVVDFYSLSEKKTSTDVGGLDFIYEDIKENFILKATDTIYKYVESNVYGDRKQELPKVVSTTVTNVVKEAITYDSVSDQEGYTVTVTIEYEKDMDYPKEVTLTFIHKEKKLYIVEVK